MDQKKSPNIISIDYRLSKNNAIVFPLAESDLKHSIFHEFTTFQPMKYLHRVSSELHHL